MNTNFRQTKQFRGPPWLVGNGVDDTSESATVGYVSSLFKDAYLSRLRLGLLARCPIIQTPTGPLVAPDDALAAMGRDRGIRRGFAESSASYAARLILWLTTWQGAGNPYTLMDQLAAYCGPLPSFRTVDVQGNWFSRSASGARTVSLAQGNWDWDGDGNALKRWSRFWVICYPNGLWSVGPNWGGTGFVWGATGETWGTTATTDQVQGFQAIVSQWKPAGTTCVNIIIAFDNSSFNPATSRDGTGLPNGTWGDWSTTVAAQRVPGRLSTALYWDGGV